MEAHTVQPWASYLGGRRDAASLVQLLTQEQEDPPAKQGSNRKLMAASGTALVLAASGVSLQPLPLVAFCALQWEAKPLRRTFSRCVCFHFPREVRGVGAPDPQSDFTDFLPPWSLYSNRKDRQVFKMLWTIFCVRTHWSQVILGSCVFFPIADLSSLYS